MQNIDLNRANKLRRLCYYRPVFNCGQNNMVLSDKMNQVTQVDMTKASEEKASANFDSLAEDVVGAIIKKACQGVEDRLDAIEGADDDIWPNNLEYDNETGRNAISKYIHAKWSLSSEWKFKIE